MDPALHPEDWLGRTIQVVVDRPLGSLHPRYPDLRDELNYGYVPGTRAPDGESLDALVDSLPPTGVGYCDPTTSGGPP